MNATLLAAGFVEQLFRDLGISPPVLAVQALLFIVTFFALKSLLFGRVMNHMKAREEEAHQAAERIKHGRHELERLEKEYATHLARIEKEAYDGLQAVLKEAIDARGRIVSEAQQKAAEESRAALAAIAQEKQSALVALKGDVLSLAKQSAEKVLDVPVDGAALEAAIRQRLS